MALELPAQTTEPPIRSLDNVTFQKGEFLKFRVHYGFITAGYATLKVGEKRVWEKGRPCHHIAFTGTTNPKFDWIFKVRDVYESFLDEEALLSWRFNRSIEEGSFSSYTETHFDHWKGKARYIHANKHESIFSVPDNIQDVISAFYFARTFYDQKTLKVGDKISLKNFIDRKTFALEAKVLSREEIEVEGSTYKALKFDLLIEESGMITDGSTIQFWISDDDNKIPLRIESDLMIGSLKADLMSYSGLSHPLTSLVKKSD
ncbi:MAG: DUF3108 domain-containing protein [Bacteroidota bacterium]